VAAFTDSSHSFIFLVTVAYRPQADTYCPFRLIDPRGNVTAENPSEN